MKTSFSNQTVIQFPPQWRAGMTLIEVVVALAITGLTVGESSQDISIARHPQ